MIIIGLTGSIATGKTTITKWLKELNIPVFNADEIVHTLFMQDKDVIDQVTKLWPDCVIDSEVDRTCLRKHVINDPPAIKQLEKITHPKVRQKALAFINENRELKRAAVVLDVPLLYESNQNNLCDCVIVVHCSLDAQRQRAANRGVPLKLLESLLKLHLSVDEKLALADYSINTDGALDQTREKLLEELKEIGTKYKISLLGA